MASYAKRISLTIRVEAETLEAAEQEIDRVEENIACVKLGNDASNFVVGEEYELDLDESDILYRHDEQDNRWVGASTEQDIADSGHENGP